MATRHERIEQQLTLLLDELNTLRTEIELIDGSDARDRERRGGMRASVGMIDYLLRGLRTSAGYMTTSAYDTSPKEI